MPDKPLLIFPAATLTARAKLESDKRRPGPRPSKEDQRIRLGERFAALAPVFGTVQATATGVDPEQVLVFEVVGSVAAFQSVVTKIPGMEWLGDFDIELVEADPGFLADGAESDQIDARLFVLAANRTAYSEVLRLWNVWQDAKDDKLPRGYGKLADVFKYLNDVRPWSAQDRVASTGIVAWWEKGLIANEPTIRFEIELWCRGDPTRRAAAFAQLDTIVTSSGGQCIRQAAIPEIDYHGVLVDLPAAVVREAADALRSEQDTALLRLVDVRYFSPTGQAVVTPMGESEVVTAPERPTPTGEPIVAILDGLPLTNHASLQRRLVVDDPDDFGGRYSVGEHRHGTAMASLVVHDEYDSAGPALGSKVYIRPLMQPGQPGSDGRRWEAFPSDELPVDLVHRAVRRMFEADGGSAPTAPTVKVINLSVCDSAQPFDRELSPWARLIDWLSSKYGVLFVVSAGNHLDNLSIPSPYSSIATLSDSELRAYTLRAMASQRLRRRLLAPAESLNALSVGALHTQIAPDGTTGRFIDLLRGASLPSPVSSVASGYRRSVKPEILVPGGRRYYALRLQQPSPNDGEFELRAVEAQPGQLVAACDPTGTSNAHATRVSGSSNAAALTTRRAALLAEDIAQLRRMPGGESLDDAKLAVILKALLVHGASWGDWFAVFDSVFDGGDRGPERWWRIKRACTQFLGYGPADFDRGTICNDERVIMLGCGALKPDEAHAYDVPLPTALNAQTVQRRLTITLAWFTPINSRHRDYRVADLWFDPPTQRLNVKRRDADHDAVTRGTVQHEVLEGTDAVPVVAGDSMPVQVNCRSSAGTAPQEPVPYALLVSLETAEPLGVSIYDQVKAQLELVRSIVPIATST